MTITSTDQRKAYEGNGLATQFVGPRAFKAEHLRVFVGNDPSYTLVPTSQYTVRGLSANQTVVTFNTAPASGKDILILRTVPYDQPTSVTNQGVFLPQIHEDAFDYRVMQIQQLVDGSLSLVFEDGSGEFVWDAKGSRIINLGNALNPGDAVNLTTLFKYIDQAATGGIGVDPKYWPWVGDGTTKAFPIPGADVSSPLMFDTAQEQTAGAGRYLVLDPAVDFTIEIASDPTESLLRMAVAPANGVHGFTVMRGFARPYSGDPPLTTVAPIVTTVTANTVVDAASQNALLIVDASADVTITIRSNTGSSTQDWTLGEGFSVQQKGAGKVTLAMQSGGTITPSPGFLAQTRGQGSIISATCTNPATNAWASSGDLLRVANTADKQHIALIDRSVLIGTNITAAAGTAKNSFTMPYGLLLDAVADGGLYATLSVAQAAGSLVTVDVKRNGVSILSTKLTFDNAERTTVTAATPPVILSGGNVLSKGDEITIEVTQIGTALAKGLTVYLVGSRIS
ncbi:hypothetical protein [Pseudoxanthomonas sp. X-1]|uniref:hypothetical protein n=1 Tax=Pseudoxanthomonas sp. X-1 TaxID=2571115 RepID=UPI00110BEACF|nr:hypothetical protein [Pseudoxanthomonas sp. X-1]TMN24494.1 hypothetical protein FF950_05280 [Pseudoxanthomonas sp. X-1]UAY75240.1 hypothetical protein LAJ50_02950 [Pseudoxanthomonas sp. X-1]